MDQNALMTKMIKDLDSLIIALKAKVKSRDCMDECEKSYNDCIGHAGSTAEQAACRISYSKCLEKC
jgi:hypothetical protein